MEKLEKLTQDELGRLYRANGNQLLQSDYDLIDKIKTLVLANPAIDVSDDIDKMAERNSLFIPKNANSYVASEFNPDTQHLRKSNLEGDEKFYSVYAVQFYYVYNIS